MSASQLFEAVTQLAVGVRTTKHLAKIKAATSPLRIVGSGSRQHYGAPTVATEQLSTLDLNGIIDYQPTELFVRAGAGTSLGKLRKLLAAHDQILAADPSGSNNATIGGALACGVDGPMWPSTGGMRDHLLGCKLVDGNGQLLTFGGNLIKNVAGFDVTRLQVGALGTLGVLEEVSLRVAGLPAQTATQSFDCSAHEAVQLANAAVAKGLPVSASVWSQEVLYLRLAGSLANVNRARHELGGKDSDDAERQLWQSLRELTWQRLGAPGAVWLCRLPPLAELACDDQGIIEWHGARRWFFSDAPANLREQVASAGGSAVLWRMGPDMQDVPVFPPLPAPLAQLHQRLKAVFDPRGILNPGRRGYA